MLLRRFMKHLKEQNWFAVGLDIVVVIVGIFLGIQVTNWQEVLKEQSTAERYLMRLNNDLKNDIEQMNRTLDFWQGVVDYSEVSLSYLEDPNYDIKEPWQLVLSFFQASQIEPYVNNDITHKELQMAGQLSLIESHELRQRLAEYYSFNDNVAADQLFRHLPEYRERIRGLVPTSIIKYIWTNCYNVQFQANLYQNTVSCKSPVSKAEAIQILVDIKNDNEILLLLRFWYSTQISAMEFLPQNAGGAKELSKLVSTEIEKIQ